MLHHEESPEKSQYNIEPLAISRQPPFCLTHPPFLAKIFRIPPLPLFPSILKKSTSLPSMKWAVRTMSYVVQRVLIPEILISLSKKNYIILFKFYIIRVLVFLFF